MQRLDSCNSYIYPNKWFRQVASFLKVEGGGQPHPKNLTSKKNKNLKIVKFLIRVGVGDGGVLPERGRGQLHDNSIFKFRHEQNDVAGGCTTLTQRFSYSCYIF